MTSLGDIGERPFLFGHSLGGLTVIRYAETKPDKVRGVVASSPALARSPRTPSFMVFIAKLLGKLAPGVTFSSGLDPNFLSRDPEAVTRYIADPLIYDRISAKLGRSVFENMRLVLDKAGEISAPVLLMVGTGDVITPPEGAKKLFERLKVKDKTLKEFKGAYHGIFEDPEWAGKFHEEVVKWLREHA